ncbi:CGNR zinc finger domain-containing protein [Nocardiopsis trehalosi]|jgi:hypothetical protein|uniref:CGNR zinc finger domain-containing protein n=1 Tax=Nocardiopsis trehalosi TaxID=109329 RepID=UPI00082F9895|nr:CGNR zinc finger domain-containing protein [Nocardiopsis trehalosi]
MPQNAIAGRSVRAIAARTADLANLVRDPACTPGDVAAVLRNHGETDPHITPSDVADLRTAAERLRAVLTAPDADGAAAAVNRLLAATAHPPRLTSHGGTTHWHLHVDTHDDAPWAEWFTTSACLVFALLITDRQRPPGGVCASPSCGLVFVDAGSGSPRRYCSRRCATRERVAAHRVRTRG